MKNKIALGVIFLMTYLGFLIATLPATVVLGQITLPKSISLSGVTGSIWHTQIAQVAMDKTRLEKVDASLSFWSLFSLSPAVSITFGDAMLAGPEGQLELAMSAEKATISNLTVLVKANEVAQQLTLPLPVSARGDVELSLAMAEIDLAKNNQCISAQGVTVWSKAGIIALEQNIPLGQLSADIGCENGALALTISPKNDLGLTFKALVGKSGSISGNGHLKPGAKFPKALNDALPFLGNKDRQGRYRLKF